MTSRTRQHSGKVFRDLGFSADDAAHLEVRAVLMSKLTALIGDRQLSQAQAADLLGVSQPRVSDLVRGKIDKFSVDTLINMLAAAGARVSVEVTPTRGPRASKAPSRRKRRAAFF